MVFVNAGSLTKHFVSAESVTKHVEEHLDDI
jgi:hypothetical protein